MLVRLDQMVAYVLSVWLESTRSHQVPRCAQNASQAHILLRLVPHTTHVKNAWQIPTLPKEATNKPIAHATLASQGPTGIIACSVSLENSRLQQATRRVRIELQDTILPLWVLPLIHVKNAPSIRMLHREVTNKLIAFATLARQASTATFV